MNKAIIRYLGTNFILPHGCNTDDTITQRFYELCLKTYENETMCVSDRLPNGGIITIPRYANICSAICQGVPESALRKCPHRGRMVQELDDDGNLLEKADEISNSLNDIRARARDGFALLG